jgi:hypothetical protein
MLAKTSPETNNCPRGNIRHRPRHLWPPSSPPSVTDDHPLLLTQCLGPPPNSSWPAHLLARPELSQSGAPPSSLCQKNLPPSRPHPPPPGWPGTTAHHQSQQLHRFACGWPLCLAPSIPLPPGARRAFPCPLTPLSPRAWWACSCLWAALMVGRGCTRATGTFRVRLRDISGEVPRWIGKKRGREEKKERKKTMLLTSGSYMQCKFWVTSFW